MIDQLNEQEQRLKHVLAQMEEQRLKIQEDMEGVNLMLLGIYFLKKQEMKLDEEE